MARNEVMFVGLTGLPGAGKGEFVSVLKTILSENDLILKYYSLSDELRDEAIRRGLEVKRPTLRKIGNELRRENGNGALAMILMKKIRSDLKMQDHLLPLVVIIDAIRNPEEVKNLRTELDSKFLLVAITASNDLLIERLARRARYDEDEGVLKEKEKARELLSRESGQNEPVHGLNINKCIAMADFQIENESTLESLSKMTFEFANQHIL